MVCERCGKNEKPLTLKELAHDLGVPYWKVQRAAKVKLFPTYTLFNTRRLAFKSDVLASMSSSGEEVAK